MLHSVLKATVFVCKSCTVCLKATVQVQYSVHGRVMVDRMYDFQYLSFCADCTF